MSYKLTIINYALGSGDGFEAGVVDGADNLVVGHVAVYNGFAVGEADGDVAHAGDGCDALFNTCAAVRAVHAADGIFLCHCVYFFVV